MVMQNKPVKGPGNQSGFGTPGTQQTAQKNVRTGGMDPYNNFAKQAQRQGKSAYQRSLTPGVPAPTPTPGLPRPAPQRAPEMPARRPQRMPEFGRQEIPRTGYEMLGGLPHEELLSMNERFGLSNLTRIPGEGQVPVFPGFTGAEIATPFTGPSPRDQPGREVYENKYAKDKYWSDDYSTYTGGTGYHLNEDGTWVYTEKEDWEGTSGGGRAKFHRTDPEGNEHTGTKFQYGQDGEDKDIVGYDEYSEDHPNVVSIDGKTYWVSDEDLEDLQDTDKWDELENKKAKEEAYDKLFGNIEQTVDALVEDQKADAGDDWVSPEKEAETDDVEEAGNALKPVLQKIQGDFLGIEGLEEIKEQLGDQANEAYQYAYQQMARQYAMMGTTGSGAMMYANNTLANNIYGELLDKYAQLDMKNMDQIEIDQQEAITNLMNLSAAWQGYGKHQQFVYSSNMLLPLQALKMFDETMGQMFIDILEMHGGEFTDFMASQYFDWLDEFLANSEKVSNGEWTEDQWSDWLSGLSKRMGDTYGEHGTVY